MVTSHIVDEKCHTVFVVGCGRVSDKDMLDSARAVRADPRLKPGMSILTDLSAVVQIDVTRAGVRQLVEYMVSTKDEMGSAKRAFVVKKTGMAVMVDLFALSSAGAGLNLDVQLFQDIPNALDWLGIVDGDYSTASLGTCSEDGKISYDKVSQM